MYVCCFNIPQLHLCFQHWAVVDINDESFVIETEEDWSMTKTIALLAQEKPRKQIPALLIE